MWLVCAVARIIAQVTGIAVVNERNINNCQREDFTSLRASLKPLLLTDSNRFAGTERHMLDLARALADAGVQVSMAVQRTHLLNEGVPNTS